jgi:hypothetical protein
MPLSFSNSITRFDRRFMTSQKTPKKQQQFPLLGRVKGTVASALVLALVAVTSPSPARAAWQDKSGSLPGTVPTGAVIGAGVGAAAIVGLLIYYKMHNKGKTRVKLDAPPVKFDGAPSPGQSTERLVPLTNMMSEPVTVKSLVVEGSSNAFAVSDARQVPFTMAPQEKVEIPLKLSASNASGKARLRIVASAPNLKKDSTKFVSISYGSQTSKLGKLLHKQ